MLISVINPNTTSSMTGKIGRCARSVAGAGTTIEALTPTMGPASIESHYDEALAVPGLLTEIAAGERRGVDGYVVACFGDPGLDAAREIARGPVIGIAEAAMRTAMLLGRSFGVVTTLGRTRGRAWELVHRYGAAAACRTVRASEIPVLDLELPGSAARDAIAQECKRAVAEDDVDVIVLGCAGMADLCRELSDLVGVPVVDGVAAATTMVEGLVRLGLTTSHRSEYAPPPPKRYRGLLRDFQIAPA
ncbi:aspartate/glutamate racemase family protein [Nakamurella sp.]|uniref:aspartate/glutamate racemase family protein n=1 Tax=Nakamurella sp. TaxID=1869182 RepID=UPI003B3B2ACB